MVLIVQSDPGLTHRLVSFLVLECAMFHIACRTLVTVRFTHGHAMYFNLKAVPTTLPLLMADSDAKPCNFSHIYLMTACVSSCNYRPLQFFVAIADYTYYTYHLRLKYLHSSLIESLFPPWQTDSTLGVW